MAPSNQSGRLATLRYRGYAETVLQSNSSRAPEAPLVDDNGVDRTQIRQMLALTPEQRLRVLQDHAESVLAIREANGIRALR